MPLVLQIHTSLIHQNVCIWNIKMLIMWYSWTLMALILNLAQSGCAVGSEVPRLVGRDPTGLLPHLHALPLEALEDGPGQGE